MKIYYKVLKNGESFHGGSHKWPLPTADAPGEWVEHSGSLEPCAAGLHVTTEPAAWMDVGATVFLSEIDGEILPCDTAEKFVCRRVRLVRALTAAELVPLQIFSEGEHVVSQGKAFAFGVSRVEAWGSSSVEAWGSSRVVARGPAASWRRGPAASRRGVQ